MSQKEGKFQSKSRFGGGKGKGGGFKGRGKPGGGGFGKKFEGDRKDSRGGFGGKSKDFGGKSHGGFGGKSKSFGSKPRFDRDGDKGGDRPFKRDGDRPYQKREWKPREDRGGSRGGDRPYQKREFKPRDDRGGDGERSFQKREWKPREDRGDREFKPRDRREGGGRPRDAHKPYKRYDDKKSFDRKPRRDADDSFDAAPQAEASFETRQKLKSERPGYGAPSSAFLYGVHAVTEALKNEKRIHQRLLVTQRGYEAIAEAFQQAADEGLNMPQVIYVEKEDIDRLLPRDAVHQDILLDCQPLEETFLSDILVGLKDDENAKILVLDQVTDPHNVGAIIRTAAAFGVAAVVVQKLNAPDITGIVAKSASGAVEHVPYVRETNLSRALEQLKEAGFFCIGLDERGKRSIAEAGFSGRVALVMGAEGDGLRRLVAENCDELVKLPTQGPIASLNVSNAAAVAVYELIRK